ncbi:MAG: DUF4988 domain-containing protein [Dysgonamonadaceae bacterium]|jgi:outer membrane lipoprotein-sorting protein|nr:DUF4988 domain-containing protein [Dysgonamonadaceae bacterium]
MKRVQNILLAVAILFVSGCSEFDDSSLRDRIDNIKIRMEVIDENLKTINAQLATLSEITGGNVITSISQDDNGNYILNCKDSKNITHTVKLAVKNDLINLPLLGVKLDTDGIYYWTTTIDELTSWLYKPDTTDKIPVSGHTPVLSVDAQGYWTVDGTRILDSENQPVEATDDQTSVFKDAEVDSNGNLVLTLGNGEVLTIQVFSALNLCHTAEVINRIDYPAQSFVFDYSLMGANATDAIVDIAKATSLTASIDKSAKKVLVSFPAGFTSGSIIMVAYDLEDNTVIRPVYFESSQN